MKKPILKQQQYIMSQSLLLQVFIPMIQYMKRLKLFTVAIPSITGLYSYVFDTESYKGSYKSQSLLLQVFIPIQSLHPGQHKGLVAIPSITGLYSYYWVNKLINLSRTSQSLLLQVFIPMKLKVLALFAVLCVAIPSITGLYSYYRRWYILLLLRSRNPFYYRSLFLYKNKAVINKPKRRNPFYYRSLFLLEVVKQLEVRGEGRNPFYYRSLFLWK